MYTFQLNITSFSSPIIDGTYIDVPENLITYNNVNVELKKYKDEYFKRTELNGTIKFLGSVYTAIKDLSETNSKIKIKVFKRKKLKRY